MSEAMSPQYVLRLAFECQQRLDDLGAEIAAAHLDAAVRALRDQFPMIDDPVQSI
jgi:hypothetical protein